MCPSTTSTSQRELVAEESPSLHHVVGHASECLDSPSALVSSEEMKFQASHSIEGASNRTTSTTKTKGTSKGPKKSCKAASSSPKLSVTKANRVERHFVQHVYRDYSRETMKSMMSIEMETPSTASEKPRRPRVTLAVVDGKEILKRKARGGVTDPFPLKVHEMLEGTASDGLTGVVSWQPHGRAFMVRKPKEFVDTVMPMYFRQSKLTSFQRQLNLYGFCRITKGPDAGGYYHELFLRGKKFLCYKMVRTRVKGTGCKGLTNPESEPNLYGFPWCHGDNTEGRCCEEHAALEAMGEEGSTDREKGGLLPRPTSPQSDRQDRIAPIPVTPSPSPGAVLKDADFRPYQVTSEFIDQLVPLSPSSSSGSLVSHDKVYGEALSMRTASVPISPCQRKTPVKAKHGLRGIGISKSDQEFSPLPSPCLPTPWEMQGKIETAPETELMSSDDLIASISDICNPCDGALSIISCNGCDDEASTSDMSSQDRQRRVVSMTSDDLATSFGGQHFHLLPSEEYSPAIKMEHHNWSTQEASRQSNVQVRIEEVVDEEALQLVELDEEVMMEFGVDLPLACFE